MIRTTAAGPVTATATCRRAALGLVAFGVVVAGCGGTTRASSAASRGAAPASRTAFAWLHPAPVPTGWHTAVAPAGAVVAYPPTWKTVPGDRGTATAALIDRRGRYLGYLNLTPRQGAESISGWASFRVSHNRAEGDVHVILQASARSLRFRTGQGACVRDAYATRSRARFIEIACLVRGRRATTVIVGAAPPDQWARQRRVIERAIDSFVT